MKFRNTLMLAVLAGGMVAGAWYYGQQESEILVDAAIPTRTISTGITSGTIERIEILAPEKQPVTLTRDNGEWYSNAEKGHVAEKSAIQQVFSALEKDLEGELVSSRKESHANYLVDETAGTRVKLYAADKTAPELDLVIGKEGANAFTTFVREPDSDDVLSVRAMLSMAFRRPDGWRNLQIFQHSSENVTRIEAEGTSATYTIAKSGDTWTLEQPPLGEAHLHQTNSIVSLMSNFRTPRYAETTASLPQLGLEPPHHKVTVQYRDDSSSPAKTRLATLLIGNKDEPSGDYYAKSGTNDSIFFVGEHVVRALAPVDVNRLAMHPPTDETTDENSESTAVTTVEPSPTDDVSTAAQAMISDAPVTTDVAEALAADAEQATATAQSAPPTTTTAPSDEQSQDTTDKNDATTAP